MIPARIALHLLLEHAGGPTWARRIVDAAQALGTRVVKRGRGPGSLEDEATAGLDYRVLVTEDVRTSLDWLWEVYTHPRLHALVQDRIDEPVRTIDDASAINVNLLDGRGARYELHTDPDPYTLLLFVTTHAPGEGGVLILEQPNPAFTQNRPIAGEAILFDGAATPHTVTPLAQPSLRVSVPMVFLPTRLDGVRPDAVDRYLYTAEEA